MEIARISVHRVGGALKPRDRGNEPTRPFGRGRERYLDAVLEMPKAFATSDLGSGSGRRV
jgi:hypothetical protein